MNILAAGTKARNIFEQRCRALCKKYNINQTGLDVLLFLDCDPEHNTARDICSRRGLKSGLTSVILEQLIEKGLLERTDDPWDGRVKRLRLTDQAEPILAEGRKLQDDFMRDLGAGIDPGEFEQFWATVERLIHNIAEMDKNTVK